MVCAVDAASHGAISPSPCVQAGRIQSRFGSASLLLPGQAMGASLKVVFVDEVTVRGNFIRSADIYSATMLRGG